MELVRQEDVSSLPEPQKRRTWWAGTPIDYDREMRDTALLTRRSFVGKAMAATVGGSAAGALGQTASAMAQQSSTYIDLFRNPDFVTAYAGLENAMALTRTVTRWQASGVEVEVSPEAAKVVIRLSAPGIALTQIHVRWTVSMARAIASRLRFLGDQWERSYGDLAWRGMVPERVMPWYFATYDGAALHGYGVETGAGALCFRQIDPEGVSLWLDVANGGSGVVLGQRQLYAATVVARKGEAGEEPMAALGKFCRVMCAEPRPASGVIYGTNDWYYAYGNSSQEQILEDAQLAAELRPPGGPRPFTVMDEGWANKAKFPDMQSLADRLRKLEVRPGIWIRPLRASHETNTTWLMPEARFGRRTERAAELAYDPTVPEALEAVRAQLRQLVDSGFELVKHDFSTYDMLGQWGFEMGAQPALPGWSFHDRSRTNAEIISGFYREIRRTLGEQTLILGCNTMGQLSAGVFDAQRTGDDTSGKIWERTRRMGVNTIAFRLAQHRNYFVVDGDCVAVTSAVPWRQTQEWLQFVAASGTALFVSVEKRAMEAEQKSALKVAFALASALPSANTPADWFASTTPELWGEKRFAWSGTDGAWPFTV